MLRMTKGSSSLSVVFGPMGGSLMPFPGVLQGQNTFRIQRRYLALFPLILLQVQSGVFQRQHDM